MLKFISPRIHFYLVCLNIFNYDLHIYLSCNNILLLRTNKYFKYLNRSSNYREA